MRACEIGKRKFMAKEHGSSVKVMKQIKELLDPNGIMNPGKIFEKNCGLRVEDS